MTQLGKCNPIRLIRNMRGCRGGNYHNNNTHYSYSCNAMESSYSANHNYCCWKVDL